MEAVYNARFQMWCRLIPGYAGMTRTDKRKAQSEFLAFWGFEGPSQLEPLERDYRMIPKEQILEGCNCNFCRDNYNLRYAQVPTSMKKKEENTMNTLNIVASAAQSSAQTFEHEAREYLRNRLSKTYWTKTEDLRPSFGLEDDSPPKTPKEVIERITSGMYMLPEEPEDDFAQGDLGGESWYQPWNSIRWRDPAKKKDRDGYNLALKTLAKDRDATQDIIMTSDGKAGLEALQKFESTAIH